MNDGMGPALRKVCVLGLGYIGLPTASMFAVSGHSVLGVDPNPRILNLLGIGRLHLEEPNLDALVAAAVNSGQLRVRATPAPADVFIIAVPTPFVPATKRADLSYVEQAGRDIVPVLRPGNLVILESTVPPGTTVNVLAPILAQSGLTPGRDVFVAHCPERVLPGRILLELVQNERQAGGLTPACAAQAAAVYRSIVTGRIWLTDATTAELVKVMENTYRDVNIALANEFALIAERVGVDVHAAIDLANHHPRVHVLQPGPGVGGHCVAVDPWFLVQAAPEEAQLIRRAREVNDSMPDRVVQRLASLVAPPAPVALLGVTYKADVDDPRESAALKVAARAVACGYEVRLCDPHVNPDIADLPAPLLPLDQAVRDAAAVVILVSHAVFKTLDPDLVGALVRHKRVLDACHGLDAAGWAARGFKLAVLGNGEIGNRHLASPDVMSAASGAGAVL
jgi:UDP-N-acetyl-D-mannosaminuronic acid dehydrogenase